ncbi:MAG: hypothetical protein KAS23_17015 [Anaerohalosphaera sp.]|nr:hypothetical protein [Anaerohalosphaera sp.]
MSVNDNDELMSLLNALREGVISESQFERLDKMIASDPMNGLDYVDYVNLWADLVSMNGLFII